MNYPSAYYNCLNCTPGIQALLSSVGGIRKTFHTSNFAWNALSHFCFTALSIYIWSKWHNYNFICSCEPSTRPQRYGSFLLSAVPNNMEGKYLLLWMEYILIVLIVRHEQLLSIWCVSSGFLSSCLTSRNAVGPSFTFCFCLNPGYLWNICLW